MIAKNCCFLLRTLEDLHRRIQEQIFQPSLPDTRKNLYDLLREIEETGGWPYIERMKLQALLANFCRIRAMRLLKAETNSLGAYDRISLGKRVDLFIDLRLCLRCKAEDEKF